MRSRRLGVVVLMAMGACAQSLEERMTLAVAGVPYPPLAKHARISGEVRARVEYNGVTVVTGHPLLRLVVMESAKALAGLVDRKVDRKIVELKYHFVLVETTERAELTRHKRGNAIVRPLMRLLGIQTERVVEHFVCEEARIKPPNEVQVVDGEIEVRIHGSIVCLQTETVADSELKNTDSLTLAAQSRRRGWPFLH